MEFQFAKIRQLEESIFNLEEEKRNEEHAKNKALQEVQVAFLHFNFLILSVFSPLILKLTDPYFIGSNFEI
jgi:hypothetical protein